MKTKFILTGILLLLLGVSLNGQDIKMKFFWLEAGADFLECEEPGKDYIRADIEPYYYDHMADNIRSLMYSNYIGAKFEYRFAGSLLGASGGIRYYRTVSSIGKGGYSSDFTGFFYVRYKSDGTDTEYARVRGVLQKSDYISVPLELRIYPYTDRRMNIYYKAGGSFNLNLGSETGISFRDSSMDQYESEVIHAIEGPLSYFGTLHLGIGVKFGRSHKPGFNIEANIPVAVLTPGKACFVRPQTGTGVEFLIRVPLFKNE